MTTNYHTPHVSGDALTAAELNQVYSDLDGAITANAATASTNLENAINGTTSITQLRLGRTTLTIASGAISVTRSSHFIDTEGAAATDDLDTINGGTDGDVLELYIVSSARTVNLRHNIGNIRTVTGGNIEMVGFQVVQLRFVSSFWLVVPDAGVMTRDGEGAAAVRLRDVTLPAGALAMSAGVGRLSFVPGMDVRNWFACRAAGASVDSIGAGTITTANTPANANDASDTYVTMPTTASSGNAGGIVTAFTMVRRAHNPIMYAIVKTPADITSVRYWIGLGSAAVTNVDSIAAGTSFVGWRFSTVATDTGWRPVTMDGTTQTTAADIGTVAASTRYVLRMRVNDVAGKVFFSVNGGAEVEATATLPASATDLGVVVRVFNQVAAIRQINLSRVWVEYD
jgi:hypothetical protein